MKEGRFDPELKVGLTCETVSITTRHCITLSGREGAVGPCQRASAIYLYKNEDVNLVIVFFFSVVLKGL